MKPRRPKKGREESAKTLLTPEVRAAFVALGRIGGLKGGAKGGKTTASRLSSEERSVKMRRAVKARWERYRAAKEKAGASVPKKPTRKKT